MTQAAVKSMGVSLSKFKKWTLFRGWMHHPFGLPHFEHSPPRRFPPLKTSLPKWRFLSWLSMILRFVIFFVKWQWYAWINHLVYWWSVLKPSQTSIGWLANLEFPNWGMERKNGKKGNANGARHVSRWNSRIWLSPCNDLHQVCRVGQCQKWQTWWCGKTWSYVVGPHVGSCSAFWGVTSRVQHLGIPLEW